MALPAGRSDLVSSSSSGPRASCALKAHERAGRAQRAVRKTMTPAQDEVTLSARDLLALQAFELAARTGSFKAAAEALHITASAVSHRIAGLERTLGAKLFERGPRGVVLAPAGNGPRRHHRPRLRRSCARPGATVFGQPATARLGGADLRFALAAAAARPVPRRPSRDRIAGRGEPALADMEAGLVDVALRYGDGQWPASRPNASWTSRRSRWRHHRWCAA